jgi:7tm Odorant receptor
LTISWAAYRFEWYKCDKSVRLLIQMMIMRANKECKVAVPFFSPSLPTFASVSVCNNFTEILKLLQGFFQIIQSAGSYITLLQTFL